MKIFQLIGFWPLVVILLPVPIQGQDILYKKDSSILNVSIKEFDGRTIKFTNPADPEEKTWYLSKSALDSLKFEGKSVHFLDISPEVKLRTINRNYLHSEMGNSLSGMINLDYERVAESGRTSYVAGILINFNKKVVPGQFQYYGGYIYEQPYALEFVNYRPHDFFIRLGINFYPFNNSLESTSPFRLSTGFSLLAGSYTRIVWESDRYSPTSEASAIIVWNIKERVLIGEQFQINAGLEISMLPFMVFFCPQLGIAVGF